MVWLPSPGFGLRCGLRTARIGFGALAALLSSGVLSCGGGGSSRDVPAGVDAQAETGTETDAGPPCTPKTCVQLDAHCGRVPDRCEGIAECGDCPSGQTCGGDGASRCGTNLCKPKTCMQLDASCGLVFDGCSDVLDCGSCPAPSACGGGSTPNQCGCTPRSCSQLDANCGSAPDGCGGVVDCGDCPQGQTCGGGGTNRCGDGDCTEKTCNQVGASCGIASDGCADVLDCGSCASPDICGGGGLANQCGCTNKTCAQLEANCGTIPGACGTTVACGTCPADDTCGGGGVSNQCGCPCQLPHATTTCAGEPCHIRYCDDGWGDCDGSVSTGCETDLMGATTCPIPCATVDQCPQSHECIDGYCSPWPIGTVVPWGGSTLPKGWLEADGSAVRRSDWSELFAAIGTTFGAGDGSTTFNLPDLRGRFALGQAQEGAGAVFGDRIGALDHTHDVFPPPHTHVANVGSHAHDVPALPAHTHPWYFTLELNANAGPNAVFLKSQTGDTEPATGGPTQSSTDGSAALTTSSVASTVAIQARNPPFLAMRSLILAKVAADAPCGAIWYEAKDTLAGGAQSADGAAVSRASSTWLFNCLQTTFGAGDNATTFNLPDLRGRAALGKSQSGTGSQLGQSGGSLSHTHASTIDAVAHSLTLPVHSHSATEPPHSHAVIAPPTQYAVQGAFQFGCVTGLEPNTGVYSGNVATSAAATAQTIAVPAAVVGSGTTSSADAPYLVLNPVLYPAPTHRLDTGTVLAFAGSKIPNGWLVADGSEVSRMEFAALFAVIGTAFGAGDGATTFNLPDLQGRSVLGKAATGPASQIAAFGGSLDHTHDLTVPEHQHSFSPAPHTHLFHFPYHVHTLGHTQIIANDDFAAVQSARGVTVQVNSGGGGDLISLPGAPPATSTESGGGGTYTTAPANAPYLVMRYLIRR